MYFTGMPSPRYKSPFVDFTPVNVTHRRTLRGGLAMRIIEVNGGREAALPKPRCL